MATAKQPVIAREEAIAGIDYSADNIESMLKNSNIVVMRPK
jgi:hypothetical protein